MFFEKYIFFPCLILAIVIVGAMLAVASLPSSRRKM